MAIVVNATYENGVLKPAEALPLGEHEKVRVTIEPETSWAERTAGMLQWTGDPAVLRRIAEDDEFSVMEPLCDSTVSQTLPATTATSTAFRG